MGAHATRAPPRARIGPDINLPDLASALSSPRIDTRLWCSYARVVSPWLDPKHGYLADVVLLPSEETDTVRVGTLAATAGFFVYAPLWKNDLVLVVYPEGVTSEGGVIVGKPAWLEADPPPQDVLDNPQDLVVFARPGANARLTVAGNADIILKVDSGKVFLGDESGTEPVALGTTLKNYLDSLKTVLSTHTHAGVTVGAGVTGPSAAVWPNTPAVEAGKVEAK